MEERWIILCLSCFLLCSCHGKKLYFGDLVTTRTFMYWPNATVPFYINPEHFDFEQSTAIMTALSLFAFKTCLKFAPVMAAPSGSQHVLVFVNPEGIRRCVIDGKGHSALEPHMVTLGYECLQSPDIDMVIMKALGFPFEHNRHSRDVFIDVQLQNVEQSAIELFTKDAAWPKELQSLAYDVNSVMHFGEREYSKNGHRTIMFKDRRIHQNRVGLSPSDLRKIELVYGPECLKRDRQEKIELCQAYPGVARRKREVEKPEKQSLRVNPEITPPPQEMADLKNEKNIVGEKGKDGNDQNKPAINVINENNATTNSTVVVNKQIDKSNFGAGIKDLGIEDEVQIIIEHVYKASALALKNARTKYCNITKTDLRTSTNEKSTDILGIVEVIAVYTKSVVDNAMNNSDTFCETSDNFAVYARARCSDWNPGSERCMNSYRSTKSGPVKYSTQHRPVYRQPTRHYPPKVFQFARARDDDDAAKTDITNNTNYTNNETTTPSRKKRSAETTTQIVDTTKVDEINDGTNTTENFAVTNNANVELNSTPKSSVSEFRKMNYDDRPWHQNQRYKQNGENWDQSNVSLEDVHRPRKKDKNAHRMHVRPHRFKKEKQIEPYKTMYELEKKLESKIEPEYEKEIYLTTERFEMERHESVKANQPEVTEFTTERYWTQSIKEKRMKRKKKRGHKKRLVSTITVVSPLSDTAVPRTVRLSKSNQEFYSERKWPNGVVPYILPESSRFDIEDVRRRLGEVNRILQKKTCVRIKEITAEEGKEYEDYLVVDKSPDYVTGRVGGKQNFGSIELLQGGQHKQHAAMMVMAMLGFYFEVSRHDRDQHIRVHMRHIRPDKLHHFEKIRDDATLDLPYDYYSATHPAWQFWRKFGKTGISSIATYKENDPDGLLMKQLGQNSKLLSDSDIIKINSVYGIDCFLPKARQYTEEADGRTSGLN